MRNKSVSIDGIDLVITKWQVGFLNLDSATALELFGDADNKPTHKPTIEELQDFFVEKVLKGLISWNIKFDDDSPVPLDKENVRIIAVKYPSFFYKVINAIRDFNALPDEEIKKK